MYTVAGKVAAPCTHICMYGRLKSASFMHLYYRLLIWASSVRGLYVISRLCLMREKEISEHGARTTERNALGSSLTRSSLTVRLRVHSCMAGIEALQACSSIWTVSTSLYVHTPLEEILATCVSSLAYSLT